MRTRFLVLSGIAIHLVISCHPVKPLPVILVPHDQYDPAESYWSSGKPILVSITDSSHVAISADLTGGYLTMSVYVRNISDYRFDVSERRVSLYLFYNQGGEVTPETICGGELESVPVIDTNLDDWQGLIARVHKKTTPFIIRSKVFAAREFMEKTEKDFMAKSLVSAVVAALLSRSNRSEAAQAISVQTATQIAREEGQQHRDMMRELSTGLFQRHTIWPSTSYLGQVKARLNTSIKLRAGSTQLIRLPSPNYYQVCADFGGQEHTFVFEEEPKEE